MTFRRLLAHWLPQTLHRAENATRRPAASRLAVERLEPREVPSVTLRDIPDTDAPNNVPIFLPVTPTNTPAGAVNYTATTNNPLVSAQVLPGGTSLKLDVTGTDNTGQAFEGVLTIKLFTDVAPLATGTIVQLANQGFYNGKLFHRVLDNFVAQGGSPNGDGIGGSSLPDVADEFNRDFTFASPGVVAMANAKDDNNNSQFFITDIDTPLNQRPQFLNFNHSIVGILTSGFDTFQKIMTTPVTTSPGGERSQPVNPVTIKTATVFEDTTNAVVRVTPAGGASGSVAVTVTGSDGSGQNGTETTNVNVLPVNVGQNLQPVNSRAFLTNAPNPTIARDGTGAFTLTATDIDNDQLTFAVGVPGNLSGQPADAAVSVDAATGKVTVTPNPGFTGDIPLLVGVRDQTDRAGDLNDPSNFDTQPITVHVRAPVAVTGTLTANRTTVGLNQPVLLTATFIGNGENATGTVQFFANGSQIGTSQLIDGQARFTATFPSAGDQSVQAKYTPTDALFLPGETTPVLVTVSSDVPANVPLSATGAEPGNPPRVRVTTPDGQEKFNFLAFEESFTGGVRVATADVTGDGQDDIVAVPRFGGSPLVRVFDGQTGNLAKEVMVFEDTFRGGLYLDAGDAFQLGYSQILVGAGFTGGPRVTLYDAVQGKMLLNYFADDPAFRGGIAVDMSDLQGGGTKQFILTGVGKGGGPIVTVYDALRTDGFPVPDKVGSFLAGDAADRAGIRVGAGGLIDGTRRSILVGPFEPDSAPLDRSFDPVAVGIFPATGTGA